MPVNPTERPRESVKGCIFPCMRKVPTTLSSLHPQAASIRRETQVLISATKRTAVIIRRMYLWLGNLPYDS
jgi:hypothetical protein